LILRDRSLGSVAGRGFYRMRDCHEKFEAMLSESEELLVHWAPQLAGLA
jgi:hypothetical protein